MESEKEVLAFEHERLTNFYKAEKAFNSAMSKLQAEIEPIIKNKEVDFKTTHYEYASLDHMVNCLRPSLNKHGFSYRFTTKIYDENNFILTTIVSHKDGHKIECDLMFPRVHDDSRMKLTQRVKSAITYARRTGLEMAFGIVVQDDDADAMDLIDKIASEEQISKISALAKELKISEEKIYNKYEKKSLKDLNQFDAKDAISKLKTSLKAQMDKK